MRLLEKRFILSVSLIMAFCFVVSVGGGCKGLTENTYKGLSVTGDIGTESMRLVMKLYKDGYVNKEEYAQAREVYVKYKVAYDAAVEALASYKAVEDAGTEATLITSFEELSRLAAKLSAMLLQFQNRREGGA